MRLSPSENVAMYARYEKIEKMHVKRYAKSLVSKNLFKPIPIADDAAIIKAGAMTSVKNLIMYNVFITNLCL